MTSQLFILASFLIFASLARAYPSVGDKVTWSGTIQNALGQSSEVHITKEVWSALAKPTATASWPE